MAKLIVAAVACAALYFSLSHFLKHGNLSAKNDRRAFNEALKNVVCTTDLPERLSSFKLTEEQQAALHLTGNLDADFWKSKPNLRPFFDELMKALRTHHIEDKAYAFVRSMSLKWIARYANELNSAVMRSQECRASHRPTGGAIYALLIMLHSPPVQGDGA